MSIDTGHVKQRTCAAIAKDGFDKWYAEYSETADMLTVALENYNNGRMKRFLCELFIKTDMETLRGIMARAAQMDCADADKPAAFKRLAEETIK